MSQSMGDLLQPGTFVGSFHGVYVPAGFLLFTARQQRFGFGSSVGKLEHLADVTLLCTLHRVLHRTVQQNPGEALLPKMQAEQLGESLSNAF